MTLGFHLDGASTMVLRQPMFIITNLVFILTMIYGSSLTAASKSLDHAVLNTKMMMTTGERQEVVNVTDFMLFAWASGGALIGAYIGIVQAMLVATGNHVPMPKSTDMQRSAKVAMAFSVALLSGVIGTPAIMALGWIDRRWEYTFLLGGVVSYGAWAILYIAHKVSKHFMVRADKEGIAGVIDEAKKASGS